MRILLSFCLLFVLLLTPADAQSAKDWAAYKRVLENKDEDWYYQGWTQAPIDGDNKPFEALRLAINALQKSKKLAARIPEFKKDAKAAPFDAKAQFRWVYAHYLYYDEPGKNETDAQLLEWRQALSWPDSPRAYRYVRLRFLITAQAASGKYTGDKRLIEVGEKLLKFKANDRYVGYWLGELRSNSPLLEDQLKNVDDARRLTKANPKDSDAVVGLASAYMKLWLVSKRRSHANAAISQYKKYLTLAPKNDAFRPQAEHWVKSIATTQASWERKGTGETD